MLEKIRILDQVEVKTNGVIFVREIDQIKDNGQVITSLVHRTSYTPLDNIDAVQYDLVKDIAKLVWTEEIKSNYAAALAAITEKL